MSYQAEKSFNRATMRFPGDRTAVGEEDQSENDQGGGFRHPVAQHRRQEADAVNRRR